MKKFRYDPDPKHNDMGHIGWVILAMLIAGILFGPMISSTRATPVVQGYYVVSTISRSFDSWTVDSCKGYCLGGWSGSNPDSAQKFVMLMVEPEEWATAKDTLTRYGLVGVTDLDPNWNPAFYAVWWLSDGRTIRDNAPMVTHVTMGVDSAWWSNASVVLDSADLQTIIDGINAGAGTGVYSDSILVLRTTDSTPIGAGARIWLRPNGGGDNLNDITDANGIAEFAVDADTFYAYFWSTGYQQVTVPDTNKVGAADCKDTLWVTQTVPASQTSPALTPVTFTFYDGLGVAIKNVVLRYQLESKAATNYHKRDSAIIIDPSKVFEARSNTSGVITINVTPNDSILTTGGKTGETKWRVKAYTPDGLVPLLGNDGVAINVRASATALAYPQAFQ